MTIYLKRTLCLVAAILAPLVALAAEPAGGSVELLGKGVQIYACAATPSGAAWQFKAPEATLSNTSDHVAGQHFAGPTWQAADGSKVVGAVLTTSDPPDAGALPWLVLHATSHDGPGRFAAVAYITRTRTVGGLAPMAGCDAAHVATEVRVPYSAVYTFFTPATP